MLWTVICLMFWFFFFILSVDLCAVVLKKYASLPFEKALN